MGYFSSVQTYLFDYQQAKCLQVALEQHMEDWNNQTGCIVFPNNPVSI